MTNPKIDVLISVYNGAKTIRKSIESIQNQTIKDINIVIVDDGSTDGSLEILNDIAQKDARVKLIAKEHSGIVDSLNRGLAQCKAEFIARFDADDISFPHRFEVQLAYLLKNPQCVAVSSAYKRIDANDYEVEAKRVPPPIEAADPMWVPCREPFLMQTLLMLRKSALNEINGYRLCEVAEDSDLYWRLHEIGDMHNIDEVLGAYRLNPESISSKSIINGRRMAYWSQLVGISALRRKSGEQDIIINKDRMKSYEGAIELEEFCRLGGLGLTEYELVNLRIGASVKLLAFASYRPFELERADCRFIRKSVIEGDDLLSHENRMEIKNQMLNTGMRLILKGKFVEAYLLIKFKIIQAACRLVLKAILPQFIKDYIKTLILRRPKLQ